LRNCFICTVPMALQNLYSLFRRIEIRRYKISASRWLWNFALNPSDAYSQYILLDTMPLLKRGVAKIHVVAMDITTEHD